MSVTILNSQAIPVTKRALLQILRYVRTALRAEGATHAEVSILLTDDSGIHDLNRDYRGHDKPTDVLSFAQRDAQPGTHAVRTMPPGSPGSPGSRGSRHSELLGDVVISVETAARQAEHHGWSLIEELSLLAVHGVLHLLGYDDRTDAGARGMRAKERALGVRE
jgi:probable rRNA maturation factor